MYWEARLGADFSLSGVGYLGLGRPFNTWAYRVRRAAVLRALRSCRVSVERSRILEVGFGTGYFVDLWNSLGAVSVTGLDLTQRAVREVQHRFPSYRFHRQDIADPTCPVYGSFDLVTVFDVLFHLLDDSAFDTAVANISRHVAPGGLLFLTDLLSSTRSFEGHTQLSRPLSHYRRSLESRGLTLVALHPVFFTMSRAPDVVSTRTRKISDSYWRLVCGVMEKYPVLGHPWGAVGYCADVALQKLRSSGPSVKLLIARRDA